ncbi:hypothetical protein E1286_07365 [Nonomuraea terrae]|uniref:Uncharacterized protein n=1 Tax=Nonomuraea terrae TaxID=2530383 RepID=A0A4V2YNA6_9ACTN|nr:hypothetical protein [Nonomuraea terrae]TDD53237.1 hypothetical protein E1286_07365 [Nonomuraea terrae]
MLGAFLRPALKCSGLDPQALARRSVPFSGLSAGLGRRWAYEPRRSRPERGAALRLGGVVIDVAGLELPAECWSRLLG